MKTTGAMINQYTIPLLTGDDYLTPKDKMELNCNFTLRLNIVSPSYCD